MIASCDKACNVCPIHKEQSIDFIRNCPEFLEIDESRIGACSADNQLRRNFFGDSSYFIVIDETCFLIHAIGKRSVFFTRKIESVSVTKMASGIECHA